MSATPAVLLKGVSKRYPLGTRRGRLQSFKGALLHGALWRRQQEGSGFLALSDVNLAVRPGETVAVIGPNGSGKSTLLKLVAGILQPTAGSVEVRGRVTALIELGAGFHPEISGRDNAIINGMMLGLSRREILAQLDDIIAFAGLGQFIDEPVKTYSSGMYVRLGFAVATSVGPDVLLVDEILAVGDQAFAHRCLDRIARMQRGGTAVLMVSHDLSLVEALAHRVVYLQEGRVTLEGTAGAVVSRYRADVAAAETEEERPAATGNRWGNRWVTLEGVELLDGEGRPVGSVPWGEPAAVRLAYRVHEPQEDFVFGIAVHREDGQHVFGTNTDLDGWVPQRLEGAGAVLIEFPSLQLAPGRYFLDAAVHRADGLAFDYACQVLSFLVTAPVSWPGSYAPRHRWVPQGPAVRAPGQ